MKLLWLTDPHFHPTPAWGLDLAGRIEAAVVHAAARHADADLAVVTGDLTNDGDRACYEGLKARLDRLPCAWVAIPGNHDDRRLVAEVLGMPTGPEGRIAFCRDTDAGRLIFLDTLIPGCAAGNGAVGEAQLAWLDATLAEARGPCWLFLHHPPAPVGSPFDMIGLDDRAALAEVAAGRVAMAFAGHVHSRIAGTWRGLPFQTMHAVSFQAPTLGTGWTWETFEPADAPPGYGVVRLSAEGAVVEAERF